MRIRKCKRCGKFVLFYPDNGQLVPSKKKTICRACEDWENWGLAKSLEEKRRIK